MASSSSEMSLSVAYATLGLETTASQEKVKQAYRALFKKYHPDKNPKNSEAERTFKAINAAKERLIEHFEGRTSSSSSTSTASSAFDPWGGDSYRSQFRPVAELKYVVFMWIAEVFHQNSFRGDDTFQSMIRSGDFDDVLHSARDPLNGDTILHAAVERAYLTQSSGRLFKFLLEEAVKRGFNFSITDGKGDTLLNKISKVREVSYDSIQSRCPRLLVEIVTKDNAVLKAILLIEKLLKAAEQVLPTGLEQMKDYMHNRYNKHYDYWGRQGTLIIFARENELRTHLKGYMDIAVERLATKSLAVYLGRRDTETSLLYEAIRDINVDSYDELNKLEAAINAFIDKNVNIFNVLKDPVAKTLIFLEPVEEPLKSEPKLLTFR